MFRLRRPPAALAAVAGSVAVAVLALLLTDPAAHADRASRVAAQLATKQAQAQALRAGIAADTSQIGHYQGSISSLQAQLARLAGQLDRERAQLAIIQNRERIEQIRLTQLELQLQRADQALSRNLVATYEDGQPDALTVVLSATGFADLLERIDFLRRIKDQNAGVITADRQARKRVIAEAERLGALEAQQQKVTAAMTARSDQIDNLRIALVGRQLVFSRARAQKAGQLQATAAQQSQLEATLASLQAAQRRRQALLAQPAPGSGPSAGSPVSSGQVLSGGGFTFPLPSGSASGPGSWSQDQGVDISAPGDTPELAVASGTIVLHGIGGFGPWAPVLHLDSPIDGQDYVYYGHAGPQGQLPVGTHVGAGQVLGSVGPGIVGISTGPHVEIGFADSSGAPAPGTSGTMMSLLRGSYH